MVIGSLLEDGRAVESGSKYRKASELQQKGGSIQIIDEAQFLELLGPAAAAAAAASHAAAAASIAAADAAAAAAPAASSPAAAAPAAAGGRCALWAEKYRPQTSEEFVGNAELFRLLREWLRDWQDVCIRGQRRCTDTLNPRP